MCSPRRSWKSLKACQYLASCPPTSPARASTPASSARAAARARSAYDSRSLRHGRAGGGGRVKAGRHGKRPAGQAAAGSSGRTARAPRRPAPPPAAAGIAAPPAGAAPPPPAAPEPPRMQPPPASEWVGDGGRAGRCWSGLVWSGRRQCCTGFTQPAHAAGPRRRPTHLLQLCQLRLQLLVSLCRTLGAQRLLHLALLAGHLKHALQRPQLLVKRDVLHAAAARGSRPVEQRRGGGARGSGAAATCAALQHHKRLVQAAGTCERAGEGQP